MLGFRFRPYVLFGALLYAAAAYAQNQTDEHAFNAKRTLSIGYVLFPGFEPLDVYGPLEILFSLSSSYKLTLSFISSTTGPVSARPPPHTIFPGNPSSDYSFILGPSTVATHTFDDAPALDVIIVPGGVGDWTLEQSNNTSIETFLNNRYSRVDYILSVCSGAVSLARAGLLSGRRATTNKAAWAWITDPKHGENITWVPSARWVEDGKIWTSSGVAAGMDMMYAFLKHLYGTEKVDGVMNGIEYAPHQDAHWDPFSVVHNVPGADTSRSLVDCTGPVGINTSQSKMS